MDGSSLIQWIGQKPQDNQAFIVCLGFFDGVHLGHRALIQKAIHLRNQTSAKVCVHTYDAHPISVIVPGKQVVELTTLEEKISSLLTSGVDTVAVSHFDKNLMEMTGEEFLDQVLLTQMDISHIVTGFDHRFGFHADTGVKELEMLCQQRGIHLSVVPPVKTKDGKIISSTAVRDAIVSGNMKCAAEMLGREPDSGMIQRLGKVNYYGGGR